MIGERLKSLIKAKKLSQNKLAAMIGISSGNISDIINNKNSPSASTLALLAEQLNVDLTWLLTGKGSMFNIKPVYNPKDYPLRQTIGRPSQATRLSTYNIVGEIAAGDPLEVSEDYSYNIELPELNLNMDHYYIFKVNGSSMVPQINHGDLAVIRQEVEWVKADKHLVAVRIDGGITLKKCMAIPKYHQTLLVPFNSHYDVFILDQDNTDAVELIGILEFTIRPYI